MAAFTLSEARYAKEQIAVFVERTESDGGFKNRADRLCEALKARYSNRERAYILSRRKAERLVNLFAEGWDGTFITAELKPPVRNPDEKAEK